MAATSITQKIEQLFEPAARAARRGDADQIEVVLRELRSIWKKASKAKINTQVEEIARGMTFALEGVLGFVLASASADARHALIEGRKHALPVLHALGKRAREASRSNSANTTVSLRIGELATAVDALPQNIGDLIKAMSDCGLISVTDQGPARLVSITDIGAQLLDASKPGWQVLNVDDDRFKERIERYTEALAGQMEAVFRSEKDPPTSLYSVEDILIHDIQLELKSFAGEYTALTSPEPDVWHFQKGHREYKSAYTVRKRLSAHEYSLRNSLVDRRTKMDNQT